MKLSDITGIFGEAVMESQKAMEAQVYEQIRFLFEDPDPDDDDETLRPRFFMIEIGDIKIKYPYLALMPLRPAQVKGFKFKLASDLNLSGHEGKEDEKGDIHVSFKKGLFGNSSHIEIEGEFEGGQPSEALEQLRDKLNDIIHNALAKIVSEEI